MVKKTCIKCSKKQQGVFSSKFEEFSSLDGDPICSDCLKEHKQMIDKSVVLTTTNNVDGHKVVSYIDIGSVEVVIGTGAISEFTGGLADIFGERSTAFEKKLNTAKKIALSKLKVEAYNTGGNAVIGIDMDYTEFTSNRIGVVANGTIVKTEKI